MPLRFLQLLLVSGAIILTNMIVTGASRVLSEARASVSVNYDCSQVEDVPTTECEALVALYDSTNGEAWFRRSEWLSVNTICTWQGVGCTDGHVTLLIVAGNNLVGTLPVQLSNLHHLKDLWLYNNPIKGEIPPALGILSSLEVLRLSATQVTGAIPHEIGGLTSLRELNLGYNSLSGPLPPEIGNLMHLKYLSVDSNSLSGSIPATLGNLTELERLNLHNNQFTGPIPAELGLMPKLQLLDLSYNELTGSLPASFGNLSALRLLNIDSTSLNGQLPLQLTQLNLFSIDFSYTEICVLQSAQIQAWLAKIPNVLSTGEICDAAPTPTPTVTVTPLPTPTPITPTPEEFLSTPNRPPTVPDNPHPTAGESNVPDRPLLTWSGGDPDGGPVAYVIAWTDQKSPPTRIVPSPPVFDPWAIWDTAGEPSYRPNYEFQENTRYYWQVKATDGYTETLGPIWSFTTERTTLNPPNVPTNPLPINGTLGITVGGSLSWSSGDPDHDPVTYTVALGTSSPPPVISTVTTPFCAASNGSGGFPPGDYETTVAGRPSRVIVGEGYDPATPTYLAFFLHGDDGGYRSVTSDEFIKKHGWVLVSPLAPSTRPNTDSPRWRANPDGDIQALDAILEEMFAKYNLCRNLAFGSGASGGSAFLDGLYFPSRAERFPMSLILACGAYPVSLEQLERVEQRPEIAITTQLHYAYGALDEITYDGIQDSMLTYVNAGFHVFNHRFVGEDHCDSGSHDALSDLFETVSITAPRYRFKPPSLEPDTTYYWQVTASDGMSEVRSPVWSFHSSAPLIPSNPKLYLPVVNP